MEYALWCQPGSHSFDENEEGAKRVTTDMEDSKGVTREVTVHVCTRHAADLFKPQKRSLEQIQADIEKRVIELNRIMQEIRKGNNSSWQ